MKELARCYMIFHVLSFVSELREFALCFLYNFFLLFFLAVWVDR